MVATGFFHPLETSIVNAYIMYTESSQSARRLSHVNFQIELAKDPLQQAGKDIDVSLQSACRCEAVSLTFRLTERTLPEKVPPTATGRPAQLECVVCSKQKGKCESNYNLQVQIMQKSSMCCALFRTLSHHY